MEALGGSLIKLLSAPAIIYLHGELGTGKTTLVRGALRSLGYAAAVKSPTFTLVESYFFPAFNVHHFDLYRISDPEELEFIGFREYLNDQSIIFIEWPQRGTRIIPMPTVELSMFHADSCRRVEIGKNPAILKKIQEIY